MARALVFEAPRTGYGIDQIEGPMTVGELRRILEDYEDDTLFILSHDRRYTYGSISEYDMAIFEEDEESGDWEEQEDW